jgi:hypothetical protein
VTSNTGTEVTTALQSTASPVSSKTETSATVPSGNAIDIQDPNGTRCSARTSR